MVEAGGFARDSWRIDSGPAENMGSTSVKRRRLFDCWKMGEGAAATSGVYERSFEQGSKRYHHNSEQTDILLEKRLAQRSWRQILPQWIRVQRLYLFSDPNGVQN